MSSLTYDFYTKKEYLIYIKGGNNYLIVTSKAQYAISFLLIKKPSISVLIIKLPERRYKIDFFSL